MHTGDVASIDADGYLRISDRLKDIVKSGGEWISSISLENIIMEKKGVRRAAVIGVKDVKWGERPLAFVVLEPDHVGKIVEEDIRLHVASYVEKGVIAKIAIPEKVAFAEELPLTSVGKVDKKKLRADRLTAKQATQTTAEPASRGVGGRPRPTPQANGRRSCACGMASEQLLVAIDETPPAVQMKGLPMAFRLREPVGDRIERSRVRPKAEVARNRQRYSPPDPGASRRCSARTRFRRSGSRSTSSAQAAAS